MNRAVVYVRVSTQEQVSNYSLDTQHEASLAYCRDNGLEVDRVSAKRANQRKRRTGPS